MKVEDWVCCKDSRGYRHEDDSVSRQRRHFQKKSVGILKALNGDTATVWLVGKNETWDVAVSSLTVVDVFKTGDNYNNKICNICHRLLSVNSFAKNQSNKNTNAKLTATVLPRLPHGHRQATPKNQAGERRRKTETKAWNNVSLPDMRQAKHRRCNSQDYRRPQPSHRQHQGLYLRQLQHGARAIQEREGLPQECDGIPRGAREVTVNNIINSSLFASSTRKTKAFTALRVSSGINSPCARQSLALLNKRLRTSLRSCVNKAHEYIMDAHGKQRASMML